MARWKFDAGVEALHWNPLDPAYFFAGLVSVGSGLGLVVGIVASQPSNVSSPLFPCSTGDGFVYCCDTRSPGSRVFSLSAHDQAITALALSLQVSPSCIFFVIHPLFSPPLTRAPRPYPMSPVTPHLSPKAPGCMITGCIDGTVKVWDIADNRPSNVVSRNMNVVCSF